jgi:hypothetical protein
MDHKTPNLPDLRNPTWKSPSGRVANAIWVPEAALGDIPQRAALAQTVNGSNPLARAGKMLGWGAGRRE